MAYDKINDMYEGFIYLITNQVNNKKYIGQTRRTVKERFMEHKVPSNTNLYNGNFLYKAMDKYSRDNFSVKTIKVIKRKTLQELQDALNYYEILYISKYNTLAVNKKGYNRSPGGQMSNPLNNRSIEVDVYDINGIFLNTYKSYREASIEYDVSESIISQIINGEVGYVKSYVFRKHGDPYNKYIIIRRDPREKTYQFSRDGKLINIFDSRKEAALSINQRSANISVVIDKEDRTCGGYWWGSKNEFHGENAFKPFLCQYSFDGVLICTYDSIIEASEITGINNNSICCVCNGIQYQAGEFIWRWSNQAFDEFRVDFIKIIKHYNLNGDLLNTFYSYEDASNKTGVPIEKIKQCCWLLIQKYEDHIFRFQDDSFILSEAKNNRLSNKSPILHTNSDTQEIIGLYYTLSEAVDISKESKKEIMKSYKNNCVTKNGSVFKKISSEKAEKIKQKIKFNTN